MKATAEQLNISNHGEGHALVGAGPGSGKTTTLVKRIRNLTTSLGVAPRSIKVMMFNAAAKDDFVKKLQGEGGLNTDDWKKLPDVSTFHSAGSRIIEALNKAGFIGKYRLETSEYRHKLFVKGIVDPHLQSGKKGSANVIHEEFMRFVDLIKTSLIISPAEVLDQSSIDSSKYHWFLKAFEEYEVQRHEKGLRFFSDLLYDPMMLVKQNPEARKIIERNFAYKHLIVDEYQDVNDIQQEMIILFSQSRGCSVMAVGDADQTIYAFRGAKPKYMVTEFHKIFPNATDYTLSRTFRHGHAVASMGQHVIVNNKSRLEMLSVASVNAPKTTVALEVTSFEKPNIPANIEVWLKKDPANKMDDIAILVRTYAMSLPIELSLLKKKIPYRMDGGKTVFEKPEIRALLAGLNVAGKALRKKSVSEIYALVRAFLDYPKFGLSGDELSHLVEVIAGNLKGADTALRAAASNLKYKPAVRRKLKERADLWAHMSILGDMKASDLIDKYIEYARINEYIKATSPNIEKMEDISLLIKNFKDYIFHYEKERGKDLVGVIEHIDGLQDMALESGKNQDDAVLITSVHRAKGREWPVVIMPELWQGAFPYIPREKNKRANIEDERRLFYVAMTRAQQILVLIVPADNNLNLHLQKGRSGSPDTLEKSPIVASQFVYECNLYLAQQMENYLQKKNIPHEAEGTIMEQYFAIASKDAA